MGSGVALPPAAGGEAREALANLCTYKPPLGPYHPQSWGSFIP